MPRTQTHISYCLSTSTNQHVLKRQQNEHNLLKIPTVSGIDTNARGVDQHHGGWGLDPWKYVGGVNMFWLPKMSNSFIQNWLHNCKFHIIKDRWKTCVKTEGKTNFPRRLKQFDGLTWVPGRPDPLPLIFNYDRSTSLTHVICWNSLAIRMQ